MNFLTLLLGSYLALSSPRGSNFSYDPKEWASFKLEHGKSYGSANEEIMRRGIFAHNKHQIEQFNEHQSESAGFSLALNHLADWSSFDIASINGFRLPKRPQLAAENSAEGARFLQELLDDESIDVPEALDWRSVPGRVTQVKDQKQCGSCWAFATTGVLEGQEKGNKTLNPSSGAQELVELSEQNLVDCIKDFGCEGGYMKDALDFIKKEGGIDDEHSYPYEGRGRKCRFNKAKVAFTDAGGALLPTGDEQKLKEVVAKFGPVAVAIDASSFWFQFYRKGVFYNRNCLNTKEDLDHAVLVVGYGTDPKQGDYWIVKNSWGLHYGDKGYIKMARNRDNNCGIATAATIPIF